jgi:ATP-dependent Lon protease
MPTVAERLEKVLGLMESEISVLQVEKRIRTRVKRQMEKTQREYYLNEQMKAIQKELGDGEDGRDELAELEERSRRPSSRRKPARRRRRAEEAAPDEPDVGRGDGRAQLSRLAALDPVGQEVEGQEGPERPGGARRRPLRPREGQGAHRRVSRRAERANKLKGPILCLVGPPGVGKTSLGKSIAKATGREFVRMSLGGVRDEAEIRGHRRTYIGSMPGKVIQSMRKAKKSNPLFLLDEIDKMGMDFRGDPSSALLEVLDPRAELDTFNDHYLEVDYDLSNVMFVTTANTLNIPPAADGPHGDHPHRRLHRGREGRDRQAHLIPKAIKEARPASRRSGDRRRGAADAHPPLHARGGRAQPRARDLQARPQGGEGDPLDSKKKKIKVTIRRTSRTISACRSTATARPSRGSGRRGHGLAWTEVGGELLTIEGVMMPGKGKMTVTGNLRDVMKESISAAASYVRSRAIDFGIEPPLFDKRDIHVHVPEGATPKDGPSAGVAMATAIVSVMTGIPVRKDVAMTGEITLRGRVLPIGGLKEKLLAALRGGIKTVLIPEENAKDLAEIPDNVKSGLEIVPVSRMDEVLKHALVRRPSRSSGIRAFGGAGHRQREHQFAVGISERHPLEEAITERAIDPMLIDDAAPCHVTRVTRRSVRHQLGAHRRMQAVGSDQEFALGLRAVGERGHDTLGVLFDPHKRPVGVIVSFRHCRPQRPPDARPGAVHGAHRRFVHDPALGVERNPTLHLDAGRGVHLKSDPPHDGEQFVARSDPRPTVAEIACGTLEDGNPPPGKTQEMG